MDPVLRRPYGNLAARNVRSVGRKSCSFAVKMVSANEPESVRSGSSFTTFRILVGQRPIFYGRHLRSTAPYGRCRVSARSPENARVPHSGCCAGDPRTRRILPVEGIGIDGRLCRSPREMRVPGASESVAFRL